MGYGLTNHLLAVGAVVFVACLFIAWRRMPAAWAVALAGVRVFIPLIYFAWYADGQWTILDDLEYTEHAQNLLEQGFTPLSIFTEEGQNTVSSLAGGRHTLFTWWNLTVMWLFGAQYYVPVLLNVAVTFASAHLLAELAAELRFSPGYQRLLQVGYLLHWDTIAWSSFVNLKDLIVQLITIAFFLCAIRAVRRRSLRQAVAVAALMVAFQHLRFYVPFIIGAAAAIWVFLEWNDFRKFPLMAGGMVVGIWMMPGRAYHLLDAFSLVEVAYGIGRFVLTPQPWAIHDAYSYLLLPSTLHWLLILPAVAGGVMLWRESRVARLVLLYAGIMIVMYALAEEIQGARQRVQLSFVFVWTQLHFLWRWTHTPAHNFVAVAAGKLRGSGRVSGHAGSMALRPVVRHAGRVSSRGAQ